MLNNKNFKELKRIAFNKKKLYFYSFIGENPADKKSLHYNTNFTDSIGIMKAYVYHSLVPNNIFYKKLLIKTTTSSRIYPSDHYNKIMIINKSSNNSTLNPEVLSKLLNFWEMGLNIPEHEIHVVNEGCIIVELHRTWCLKLLLLNLFFKMVDCHHMYQSGTGIMDFLISNLDYNASENPESSLEKILTSIYTGELLNIRKRSSINYKEFDNINSDFMISFNAACLKSEFEYCFKDISFLNPKNDADIKKIPEKLALNSSIPGFKNLQVFSSISHNKYSKVFNEEYLNDVIRKEEPNINPIKVDTNRKVYLPFYSSKKVKEDSLQDSLNKQDNYTFTEDINKYKNSGYENFIKKIQSVKINSYSSNNPSELVRIKKYIYVNAPETTGSSYQVPLESPDSMGFNSYISFNMDNPSNKTIKSYSDVFPKGAKTKSRRSTVTLKLNKDFNELAD
jgi:hypothetical protein